jgi:ankyrin repeat protein
VVKLLLSHGVTDERPPGGTKTTALHWAARNGRTAVAILLLDEAGSDANAKDFTGRTPLDLAEEAAKVPGAPSSATTTLEVLKAAAAKPVKPAKLVMSPAPPTVPAP